MRSCTASELSIRKDSRLDFERSQRTGFDEAILCAGKTDAHVADILAQALERNARLLLTRLEPGRLDQLPGDIGEHIDYEPVSRTGFLGGAHPLQQTDVRIAVVCNSEIPGHTVSTRAPLPESHT